MRKKLRIAKHTGNSTIQIRNKLAHIICISCYIPANLAATSWVWRGVRTSMFGFSQTVYILYLNLHKLSKQVLIHLPTCSNS